MIDKEEPGITYPESMATLSSLRTANSKGHFLGKMLQSQPGIGYPLVARHLIDNKNLLMKLTQESGLSCEDFPRKLRTVILGADKGSIAVIIGGLIKKLEHFDCHTEANEIRSALMYPKASVPFPHSKSGMMLHFQADDLARIHNERLFFSAFLDISQRHSRDQDYLPAAIVARYLNGERSIPEAVLFLERVMLVSLGVVRGNPPIFVTAQSFHNEQTATPEGRALIDRIMAIYWLTDDSNDYMPMLSEGLQKAEGTLALRYLLLYRPGLITEFTTEVQRQRMSDTQSHVDLNKFANQAIGKLRDSTAMHVFHKHNSSALSLDTRTVVTACNLVSYRIEMGTFTDLPLSRLLTRSLGYSDWHSDNQRNRLTKTETPSSRTVGKDDYTPTRGHRELAKIAIEKPALPPAVLAIALEIELLNQDHQRLLKNWIAGHLSDVGHEG